MEEEREKVLEAKGVKFSLKKRRKSLTFNSSEAEEEEDMVIPGFLLQRYENNTWPVKPHLTQESAGMDTQVYFCKRAVAGKRR